MPRDLGRGVEGQQVADAEHGPGHRHAEHRPEVERPAARRSDRG